MKISYSWLKDYLPCDLTPEKMGEVLTAIGLEVEAIEPVEVIPGGLKGVVVGEVLTREKHPDADRLSITTVNLGEGEPVQIVCGAPNVAAGQKVLVATVGATLYPKSGESFVIKKSKIRGAESHGMICAEDELGLGESHDGIMVLDAAAIPGTPAATFLNIETDFTLEIGLTPNRTDAFSHFGVARDLKAALKNMEGGLNLQTNLILPKTKSLSAGVNSNIAIEVTDTADCPRYAGIVVKGLKVTESPKWLRDRLNTIGVRPINNVVDITNYIQHELGQPLHAFDLSKVSGNKIIVRSGKQSEKFVTLDGVERELNDTDLMICNASEPMCIAGVFGGKDSGVSESTTEIFLESAYFNPVVVRKTARHHGLHTDASFRFERGADVEKVVFALERAALMLEEMCGGQIDGGLLDFYPNTLRKAEVTLSYKNATRLIGQEIPKERIKSILSDLEIEIANENDDQLSLVIPHYRADVTREADVIEDILRIYGFDNIAFPTSLHSSISYAPKPDREKIQHRVSDMLAARGFNEIMGMSLTKAKYASIVKDEFISEDTAVKLLNPLSQDLGIMRQSLLFGGLESIELNQNHKNPDLKLYEFGKVYHKVGDAYKEKYQMGIWLTGARQPESWNNANNAVAVHDLKAAVDAVLSAAGIKNTVLNATQREIWSEAMSVSVNKKVIVRWGRVAGALRKAFDVKQEVYYAEIDWDQLIQVLPKNNIQYSAPEKYPAVRRDLSLLMDKQVQFVEIEKIAYETERKLLKEVGLFDVYEGKNLEAGKKSYAVSFILQDASKTMTDQQVDATMQKISKALDEKLGAKIRS
jgi:phenylalanyl-tRNA synthetase beta chain